MAEATSSLITQLAEMFRTQNQFLSNLAKQGATAGEVAGLIRDQTALLGRQNECLGKIEQLLPAKPGGWKGYAKAILGGCLILVALLPLWALVLDTSDKLEKYQTFDKLLSVGDLHLAKEELEEAHKRYSEALSLFPGDKIALTKTTDSDARLLTRKYQNVSRTLKPEEDREIKKLVADSLLLTRLRPDDGKAFRLLGVALQLAGRLDESIAAQEAALKLDPQDCMTYNQLGISFVQKGDPEKAKKQFDRAIELGGICLAPGHNNRGSVFLQQGNYARAKEDLNRAIAADHSYTDAYQNRGNLYHELWWHPAEPGQARNSEFFANAVRDYLRALQLNPSAQDSYHSLANALANAGHLQVAVDYYDRAEKLDPDDPNIRENKGIALAALQRNDDALKEFTAVIELSPGRASAYEHRAVIHERLGEPDRALIDKFLAAMLKPAKGPKAGTPLITSQ